MTALIRLARIRFYSWRLQRLIAKRVRSFECEQFRRRRAAALKHHRGVAA